MYDSIKTYLDQHNIQLIAVSKNRTLEEILNLYYKGQRAFGENKVQELLAKRSQLPPDIEWHLIGHLQSNKVKQIIPYISMIQSVDSEEILNTINKYSIKYNILTKVLLQVHIASEETKFGLSSEELFSLIDHVNVHPLSNIQICGLMGMATNTQDMTIVHYEFKHLHGLFAEIREKCSYLQPHFQHLSMGMSSDYKEAIEHGANMVRIGSALFQ